MTLNISIDPGTNATGICIWSDRKPVRLLTLRPPRDLSFEEKLIWQKREFSQLCGECENIQRIGIEQFEDFHAGKDARLGALIKAKMMKCSAIRGMLIGEADHWCQEVVHPNKKQITKDQTTMLATAWKINGSEHARDAFHLGICAGFDRT